MKWCTLQTVFAMMCMGLLSSPRKIKLFTLVLVICARCEAGVCISGECYFENVVLVHEAWLHLFSLKVEVDFGANMFLGWWFIVDVNLTCKLKARKEKLLLNKVMLH